MNLKHVGQNGVRHLFHLLSDGDRPVLEIYVDESPDTNAKLPIMVKGVGKGLDDLQMTKGTTHAKIQVDTEGAKPLICINCLARYVVPRAVTLMSRVYVPVNQVELDPLLDSTLRS